MPKGFADLANGLALMLIYLITFPVTNTSVNPAKSISQAFFEGYRASAQHWLFILITIARATLAGVVSMLSLIVFGSIGCMLTPQ